MKQTAAQRQRAWRRSSMPRTVGSSNVQHYPSRTRGGIVGGIERDATRKPAFCMKVEISNCPPASLCPMPVLEEICYSCSGILEGNLSYQPTAPSGNRASCQWCRYHILRSLPRWQQAVAEQQWSRISMAGGLVACRLQQHGPV